MICLVACTANLFFFFKQLNKKGGDCKGDDDDDDGSFEEAVSPTGSEQITKPIFATNNPFTNTSNHLQPYHHHHQFTNLSNSNTNAANLNLAADFSLNMLNNGETTASSFYHPPPPPPPPPPQYQSLHASLSNTLTPIQLQDHLLPVHSLSDISSNPYQYQFIHHQQQQLPPQSHLNIHHSGSSSLLNTVINNDSSSALSDHLKLGLIQPQQTQQQQPQQQQQAPSLIEAESQLNQIPTTINVPIIKQQSHTPVQYIQSTVQYDVTTRSSQSPTGLAFDTLSSNAQKDASNTNSSSSPSLSPSPPSYSSLTKRTRFQIVASTDDEPKSNSTLPLKIF